MGEENVWMIVVGVTVILAVWDIFLAADTKEGNTISEVIRKKAGKYPTIPFAFGFLMGHWFW